MAIGDIIVGIDIGTSKVSIVVGEVNSFNQIEIICNANGKCKGIKKGKIVDENLLASSIVKVIDDAEKDMEMKINSAYITVPGKYITIVQNDIYRQTKDKYAGITTRDVTSAIMQVKDIDIPDGHQIIDIVTDEFVLDDGKIVEDPIGSISGSFTIKAQVVLAQRDFLRQIHNVFKKADIDLDGIVPTTLAQRNLVLDTNEFKDNIMLLDVGAENTDIGVFEGTNFVYTNTIPLGGDTITNDIALVLDIDFEEANKLKKQYGLAMKSYIDNDTEIVLNTYKGDSKNKVVKSSEIVEIIEARVEEIFGIINKDINAQGIKQRINNVILTGQGITSISKSDVAGKVILSLPVKIATGRLISTVKPVYRTAYALVRYISTRPFAKTVSSSLDVNSESHFFRDLIERIKEFFYT